MSGFGATLRAMDNMQVGRFREEEAIDAGAAPVVAALVVAPDSRAVSAKPVDGRPPSGGVATFIIDERREQE